MTTVSFGYRRFGLVAILLALGAAFISAGCKTARVDYSDELTLNRVQILESYGALRQGELHSGVGSLWGTVYTDKDLESNIKAFNLNLEFSPVNLQAEAEVERFLFLFTNAEITKKNENTYVLVVPDRNQPNIKLKAVIKRVDGDREVQLNFEAAISRQDSDISRFEFSTRSQY